MEEIISPPENKLFNTNPTRDDVFSSIKLYSRRLRLLTRVISLTLLGVILVSEFFMSFSGPNMSPNFWGALSGVFWGALIVEINLSLFIYAIKNSKANKLDSPIWVTILKFYGLFALTVLLIIVVMFFRLGNPLWFLAGLLTFIPALFITILWGFLSVFLKHGFNGPLKP